LKKITASVFALFITLIAVAQNATLTGVIKDENGKPIEFVTVAVEGTGIGSTSLPDGSYELSLPDGERQTIVFDNVGFFTEKKSITLSANENRVLNMVLRKRDNTLTEFVKRDDRTKTEAGMIQIDAKKAGMLPSTIGGIEGILKTFVGTNNELTSQYTVRGGNYDENLVYVNDFEIYRPFLTRSGQQEGLSFINADLVSNVYFSVGGFQARYGDKMSSVLDVNYKRPQKFGGSVMASLLGASLHLEGATRDKKLTYLIGLRQKTNQYLLQAQPTKGVYNPSFTDVQANVNYQPNDKWEVDVLANYARNRFNFIPERSVSTFGLINQAFKLETYYTGSEIDQFDSRFGGIAIAHKPNKKLKLKLLASGFQTNEKETYDINGEYLLGEIETDLGKDNFGQTKTYLGTGIIHNYARNYLKVNVGNLAHRGFYDANKHYIAWGLDANYISINDQLREWERRDSSGYTQPYLQDSVVMMRYYRSSSDFSYMRYSGFIQDNFRFNDSLDLTISAGLRFNYNQLNGEFILSPRVQIAYNPNWKRDVIFKLAGGMYAQPPVYREMRDLDGNVNKDLKAQKSIHFVAGTDYNFKLYHRPFKLTAEVYYKKLNDLVPYEYDNVRIRYFGQNNAVGYAYGGELRLFGDLVKDATSWISIGLMKTEEDITNDKIVYKNTTGADSATVYPGYIPRPTDQRFMLGMYFEDYLPSNKNFKMHLNLLYASGLPFGPPDKQRYGDTLRLPAYRRVDIGFAALLWDGAKKERPAHSFFRNFNHIWLSAEVFNLLGIQNTLSYTFIQDQTSGRQFAVPNRLTSRLLNVKLAVDF
jgi:hypothetical protein